MNCKCHYVSEFYGNDAIEYAENHLKKIRVDGENWQVLFECPLTGIQWLKDFPDSGFHGGGSPRLRKILPEQQDI